MSVAMVIATHPVLACADAVEAAVKDVADLQPVFMSTAEKQQALRRLAVVEARLAELRLRVLAASGEVGEQSGARDAAAWVAHETRTDARTARADWHLAKALEQRQTVAVGMREGRVSPTQARVITASLEALPAHLGPTLACEAEQTLVGYAAHHPPRELRHLGRRILEVVAPEVAEAEESRRLEDEERRAREKSSLRFRDLGDGRARIAGILPTSVTERLKTYLQAYTSPRHHSHSCPGEPAGTPSGGPFERMPQHRAYARAFAALLENLDPDGLPEHGGDATTVMVTISLEQLRAELATAGILTPGGDESVSAAQARRVACQASIIPVVLGGDAEILDVGRAQRLFTRAQRRALRLRDRRCRAEGCTVPATWTEAHHLRPWSEGGPTDLANAINLCAHHHHRIHDRSYEHRLLSSGDVRFHRRT
ncbi:HNH endonuclease signature motif containing protein [Nocardioides humi]|uniref:HNH endonuclease signature motif containing protein n=1 Tax=Nocardioides humi TaxID=449461 RepID=UPI0031D4857A